MSVLIYQKRRDMMNVGSGFYIGPTGTGKTYALKNEIKHALANTDEVVFVISRHGEFDDLVQEHNGLVINLAKEALNPLLILDTDKIKKVDLNFLTKLKGGIVKLLISSKMSKVTNLQKFLIEQVIAQLYIESNNPDWGQFIVAFEKMLKTYKEKNIADRINELRTSLNDISAELNLSALPTDSNLLKETFLEEAEAVYNAIVCLGTMASGKELISLEGHRLIVFDVKDVPTEHVDKYCVLALEDVLTRLHGTNPIKNSRICIDDADNLFRQYDKYMSLLYKLSKTLGLVVTSVIHDTDTYLNKKSIFRNAALYYELYNQPGQMIDVLRPLFSLSEDEVDWIRNAPTGQKLVICAGNKLLIKAVS